MPPRSGLGFLGATQVGAPVGAGAGAGAATGASQGAAIGSTIVPGIGTAIGAVVGAIGGAIAGAMGKKDPENYNFDQAVAMWQQNPDLVYQIGNKYLPLAGMFDLNIKTNIPIYKRYGRMGEQKFVTDMVNVIYNAAQSGKITANDTPLTVMARVVQPWIDSWGFGPMADPHADMVNRLLIGMVADYIDGAWKSSWFARGGDFPFGSLPMFSLPASASAPATVPTPVLSGSVSAPGLVAVRPPVTAPVVVLPPSTPVIQPPPTPTTILSTDGSSTTPSQTVALRNAQGQVFMFGSDTNAWGNAIYVNGAWTDGNSGAAMGLLNNGTLYMQDAKGVWHQWVDNRFTTLSGPPSVTPSPAPSATPVIVTPPVTPPTTTVPIPAGFNVVGLSNDLPAYQGPDSALYTWTGTTMTPLTGTVTTSNGQTVQAINGQMQQSVMTPLLGTGAQQTQNSLTAPISAPPVSATPAVPVTAGVTGSGLPPWLTWGAVGGLLLVLFATARPVKGVNR